MSFSRKTENFYAVSQNLQIFLSILQKSRKKYTTIKKKYQFLKTDEFFMQFRKSTRIFAGFFLHESHKNQSILTVL